jgi:DNA-binding transcriptional regulator GbsR (MarR family)
MSIYKSAFNGSDYIPIRDDAGLSRQIDRVYACMKDGKRRTLSQISQITGDPEASVSAQLRAFEEAQVCCPVPEHRRKEKQSGRRALRVLACKNG